VAKHRHLRTTPLKTTSISKNRRTLTRGHLVEFFGTMRLDAIAQFTIKKYRKRRLDERASAAMVNRELATLSHLLSKAVEWGWIDRAAARPEKLTENPGRIIALSDEQCDALMTAAVAAAQEGWLTLHPASGGGPS